MIGWVNADSDRRAAVFIDESWFVLWPYPASAWARVGRPVRVAKTKSWRDQDRPPSCALYGQMDARTRQVTDEWHRTWNQEETWAHLEGVIAAYAKAGTRYLVVFWDHAPWHLAGSVRMRVAEHNREARQNGGVHVLLFPLPIRSPWLMPLEPVFGQTKRAVGARERASMAEIQAAVDQRIARRNVAAHKANDHPNPIQPV